MRRISQISLLVAAVACGLLVGRASSSATQVDPQGASPAADVAIPQGRFQLAHVYFSAERQGTIMIDSRTGRVYLLARGADKDGKEIQSFQQLPISSCRDVNCLQYDWHLYPDGFEGGPREKRD